MAAFSAGDHPAECAMVLPLCLELPRSRRDDGRKRSRSGSLHDQPLGVEVCPRIGQASSTPFETDERLLENRRDLHPNQREVEVFVSRCRDSQGNTLDFMLSVKRDGKAAARFFRKVLKAQHTQTPRVITVDKNAAYPVAMETLKSEETIAEETELRHSKYLNNVIEQDHRNIKRIVKPMMGFKTFNSARRTLSGIEAMNMIRTRASERS